MHIAAARRLVLGMLQNGQPPAGGKSIDAHTQPAQSRQSYSCSQAIIPAYTMGFFLLIAGSMSVVKYTDVYVVVRSFYTDNLMTYESIYQCCGIDGPKSYGNANTTWNVPPSCYRNQDEKPENLYQRGCLYATQDHWFWFVFANCYWFAFVLFTVNLITHWKLNRCLRARARRRIP